MCGIVEICGKCDEENVRKMMSWIVHPGPDARGVFLRRERMSVLGHRRLAIMDQVRRDQLSRARRCLLQSPY